MSSSTRPLSPSFAPLTRIKGRVITPGDPAYEQFVREGQGFTPTEATELALSLAKVPV